MRMTASELLNLLAELLGFDLCKQFVIPEVVSLAEDPAFRVRKSTALNFHNVCKIGGEYELFERLMPAFVRLSKDDMYRVRRACAESLCEISKHVSDDIRAGVLVEIFLRLAQDPSKLVKQSVLQQSGMFISTLPKRVISKTILDHYCNMVNSPTGDLSVDSELKHYCAYSFPGVLQTVGVEKWSELRHVYHALVQSPNPNVKQTLALSLHEIAKILGTKLAEEELVAVFEDMIQNSEIVKMGVIKHLAEFLQLLSTPCRVSYIPLLDDIRLTSSPFNWRLRQSLASQLSELVKLPPPQIVFCALFPLAMTLVQDPVAEVRKEAFKGVAKMMRVLEPGYVPVYPVEDGEEPRVPLSEAEGNNYLDSVSRAINALVHGETYHHRQLWANLCLQLITELPREQFEKYFIQGILLLTSDSVCNVRVSLAEMLVGWEPNFPAPWEVEDSAVCPWKWLMERSDIRECISRLSRDDSDVVINVSRLQPLFPDLKFEAIRCVGLKRAPGGVVPVGKGDGKPQGHDNGGDSSDSSVGGDRRSPSSSISSIDASGGKDESYDNFVPEEQTLPPLVLSSPMHSLRRFTPSPSSGLLAAEDIVALDDEDAHETNDFTFVPQAIPVHTYHHRTAAEESMDDKWPEPNGDYDVTAAPQERNISEYDEAEDNSDIPEENYPSCDVQDDGEIAASNEEESYDSRVERAADTPENEVALPDSTSEMASDVVAGTHETISSLDVDKLQEGSTEEIDLDEVVVEESGAHSEGADEEEQQGVNEDAN